MDNDFYSFLLPLIHQWAENVVHHFLECGWGITLAEVHDHWFIEAVFCFECHFVLVPIFDSYFVEASFYVELGENEGFLYFCD